MNFWLSKSIEILWLDPTKEISKSDIEKSFREIVFRSHSDSTSYNGEKVDLDSVVKAKRYLLEALGGGSFEINIEDMNFDQLCEWGRKKIFSLKEEWYDIRFINLSFWIDFVCKLLQYLWDEVSIIDWELYVENSDLYMKLGSKYFDHLNEFIKICLSLSMELSTFLDYLAWRDLQEYLFVLYSRDYQYGEKSLEDVVEDVLMLFDIYKISDWNKFLKEFLKKNDLWHIYEREFVDWLLSILESNN